MESASNTKKPIDFSDIAQSMDALKASLSLAAEDNQTKIQFIKEALATETYLIDSTHIASRLTEELIRRPQHSNMKQEVA